ncbi:BlaR1 peptidase M56 [Polaribacter litorisediminis]|uniref:M56 family metallopeptidase n=1 Tax=Polaribacter litorisediminis TaxID=1908341 RepID=UPI001CC158F0|nr:M56 family metallopeptidase [Polaribacter litorisediminis]UAM97065.1 BlaR1 peptidase M56 [Polaribacter litorisediminis]
MINYILQVILFQVLFLAIYDFFLSKETFFTKNRWYLLTTPILSFLIPLIKIPNFQKAVPREFIVHLPEIVLSPEKVIQQKITESGFYESVNYINILFWLGVVLFLLLFLIKLVKIINIIRKYKVAKQANFTLILLPNETKAFSFFNYIFLGKEIPISQQEKVIQHELVHSQHRHSLDLMFFEILKIAMWFNPMIYFYQKRITLVHEYISDAVVVKLENRETYINNLLSSFFQVENITFINQFYKPTFIKKRIIMMTKNKSKKMNQLKYLVLLPVLASMLFYTSCSDESTNMNANKISVKQQQIRYTKFGDKPIKIRETEETSYLDIYIGTTAPDWDEITFDNLTFEEAEEYELQVDKINNSDNTLAKLTTLKLYQQKNGRKVVANIINLEKLKSAVIKEVTETEEISFMSIEKAPTFPGCETGDKDCFSKMIQKHFATNFDANLPKTLGLESGRKRVFIGFKIDKQGAIVDLQVRAPHEDIKAEVLSVMSSLPKVIPGENDGKVVAVKYAIPFTIIVE